MTAALLLWCLAVSIAHAAAEARGRLWRYFGHVAPSRWAAGLSDAAGVALVVSPALLAMVAAVALAWGTGGAGWALALLAGLRWGDAVFSHLLPAARHPDNPGIATALIYLLDSAALACLVPDDAGFVALLAFAGGAAGFAAILPALRLLDRRHPS